MVSVCMATYNGAQYLRAQIDSILPQLNDDDEIIVSDDGSTDNTRSVIESYADKRIKFILNAGNKGCISNFENSIKASRGSIVFLCDQDDVWAPNKVQLMKEALISFDCVVSDAYVTDAELNIKYDSFYKCNNNKRNKYYNLFVSNHYLGCCMAFKRCVLEKALPFPTNIPMHDIWLGNVAAFYYSVCFIDDKLTYYRRHDCNASSASDKSRVGLFCKLKYRLNVVFPLLQRLLCVRTCKTP